MTQSLVLPWKVKPWFQVHYLLTINILVIMKLKNTVFLPILVTWWLSGIVTIVKESSCPRRLFVQVISRYFGICSVPLWSNADCNVLFYFGICIAPLWGTTDPSVLLPQIHYNHLVIPACKLNFQGRCFNFVCSSCSRSDLPTSKGLQN